MKYRILPLVLASIALLAGPVHAADQPAVSTEIQPLLDVMLVAANARDTDRFMAPFVHDQSLVFVFNGVTYVGFDVLRALQDKWWREDKTGGTFFQNGRIIMTVLSPTMAVVTQPLAQSRKMPDGQYVQMEFVITMVWVKRPEGWRIVQAHESTLQR